MPADLPEHDLELSIDNEGIKIRLFAPEREYVGQLLFSRETVTWSPADAKPEEALELPMQAFVRTLQNASVD